MVEAAGLQQVLSLSNIAERVHQVAQAQPDEAARHFDRMLRIEDDLKRTEVHSTAQTDTVTVNNDTNRGREQPRRDGGKRGSRGEGEPPVPDERTGQAGKPNEKFGAEPGGLLDVVV